MTFHTFIGIYLKDWVLCSEQSCGTSHGYLKLRMNETKIKVYFKLNGDSHWSGDNVRLDRIEACDNTLF